MNETIEKEAIKTEIAKLTTQLKQTTDRHERRAILLKIVPLKYPKARMIAVSNFSMGYDEMSYEARANLALDTQMYRWQTPTVNAIKFVINNTKK